MHVLRILSLRETRQSKLQAVSLTTTHHACTLHRDGMLLIKGQNYYRYFFKGSHLQIRTLHASSRAACSRTKNVSAVRLGERQFRFSGVLYMATATPSALQLSALRNHLSNMFHMKVTDGLSTLFVAEQMHSSESCCSAPQQSAARGPPRIFT